MEAALAPQTSMDFLDLLNPPQRQAVEATEGPVLVLAGAGTGKTRVLTSRIAYILLNGLAFPSQILAVTFTNKAAREMAERVQSLVQEKGTGIWLGTFHSLCVRILRKHAGLLKIKSDFTVIDVDDQLRLIKSILEEQQIDTKRFAPKMILSLIERYKDRAWTPEDVPAADAETHTGFSLLNIYKRYQQRLAELGTMDFGDLLLHTITIFKRHSDVLQEYQRRFRYVLVDEYQDTNVAQYLWLRLLATGHQNICCVGDDDQSIYGWRGAEVGNILKFEKDFPGCQVIRLEQNYRSTSPILRAAAKLIAHNETRLGKTLWTDSEGGTKVKLVALWDEKSEAHYIAEEIDAIQQIHRTQLSNVAILVRAGFQTRAFEEALMAMSIPYRVIGGLRFYERMEIRDAIAYMRVVQSPFDDLALLRIINVPKRGIGESTVKKIADTARERSQPMLVTLEAMLREGQITGKVAVTLAQFLTVRQRLQETFKTQDLRAATEVMLDEFGYLRMWKEDTSPEAQGRLDNLKELLTALEEFENLEAFLEHVSLVMDTDTVDDSKKVIIMTLHAAKGLEFNTVFLPGWEEGLFPSQRTIDEKGQKGIEEEGRLAYVGITRACRHLTILYAANRRIYNQWQSSIPSRFIDELPKEELEIIKASSFNAPVVRDKQGGSGREFGRTGRLIDPRSGMGEAIRSAYANVKATVAPGATQISARGFSLNDRVFHQKFGYGRVRKIEGSHLTIAFEKAGEKMIIEDFVEKA